jgi:hypothetical protein
VFNLKPELFDVKPSLPLKIKTIGNGFLSFCRSANNCYLLNSTRRLERKAEVVTTTTPRPLTFIPLGKFLTLILIVRFTQHLQKCIILYTVSLCKFLKMKFFYLEDNFLRLHNKTTMKISNMN